MCSKINLFFNLVTVESTQYILGLHTSECLNSQCSTDSPFSLSWIFSSDINFPVNRAFSHLVSSYRSTTSNAHFIGISFFLTLSLPCSRHALKSTGLQFTQAQSWTLKLLPLRIIGATFLSCLCGLAYKMIYY